MSILRYLVEGLNPSKTSDTIDLSPLLNYAKQYNSSEDLLRSGGFPISLLDRVAFGFDAEAMTQIDPKLLHIKWKDDIDQVKYEVEKSGLTPREWGRKIDLSEPIDVSYSNGKFWIEDGHHRYFAAKALGEPLNANVEINEKPIPKIVGTKNYNYDAFVRDIYDKAVDNSEDITESRIYPNDDFSGELILTHNKESSPNMGSIYGQDVEPAGYYGIVSHNPALASNPNYETVRAKIRHPLIIDISEDRTGWKRELAKKYKAKKSLLSKKLMQAGYDSIITTDSDGDTGEIIILDSNILEVITTGEDMI